MMGSVILLFFNGGGPVAAAAVALTSAALYIPYSVDLSDTLAASVEVADIFAGNAAEQADYIPGSNDEQVQ